LFLIFFQNANASNQQYNEIKTREEITIPECTEFISNFYLSGSTFIFNGNLKQAKQFSNSPPLAACNLKSRTRECILLLFFNFFLFVFLLQA